MDITEQCYLDILPDDLVEKLENYLRRSVKRVNYFPTYYFSYGSLELLFCPMEFCLTLILCLSLYLIYNLT